MDSRPSDGNVSLDSRSAPIGAVLRRARLDRGLSLSDVGEALHVAARYIHAIETDDYAALPPTVYTRALIREYARFLGLNPADLLERAVPMRPGDRNPIRPALQPLDRSPAVSWKAIASIMGVAACIGLFVYLYSQYNSFAQTVDAGRGTSFDLVPTQAVRSAPLRITPFATEAETSTPTPAATPTVVSGIVVEAHVVEQSWLQVWTDGRPVIAETVAGGNTRTFTAEQSIRMRVGNAGGVDVTVNGNHQGKLGADKQAMEVSWGREGTVPSASPAPSRGTL